MRPFENEDALPMSEREIIRKVKAMSSRDKEIAIRYMPDNLLFSELWLIHKEERRRENAMEKAMRLR